MLGILLLYFIGKYFYDLAQDHGKSKWLFAILGIITYYAGTFIAGLLIGVAIEFWGMYSLADMNDFVLGLMALPVGVLACIVLYQILKEVWRDERVKSEVTDEMGDY